jgi:hypothetical protein
MSYKFYKLRKKIRNEVKSLGIPQSKKTGRSGGRISGRVNVYSYGFRLSKIPYLPELEISMEHGVRLGWGYDQSEHYKKQLAKQMEHVEQCRTWLKQIKEHLEEQGFELHDRFSYIADDDSNRIGQIILNIPLNYDKLSDGDKYD